MTSSARPGTRRGVRAFLVITFGLTWLPFLPVLVGGPAVPLLMPFAPALAAVVVRRWVTKEGFADLRLRPGLHRLWPWLSLALGWPLLAMPLAAAVARVVGVEAPDLGGVGVGSLALWAGASVLAAPIFLGEELGWRGYLQIRIFPGRPLVAAAVTGVVWAVWHYPLWWTVLELPLWTFLLMTVSLVVSSVFFGWLQQRSGSVWLPALGHSTNNTFEAPFSSVAFTGGTGNAWLPLGAALVLVAAESAVQLGAVLLGPRTLGGGERGTPVPSARAAAAATSAPLSARQEP